MTGQLIKAGNKALYNDNKMFVTLNVTDICNFNCSYCCNATWRKNAILPVDILHDFIEDLGKRSSRKIVFYISGGEPLLYPHLDQMFKFISTLIPYKKVIKFITNGSLLVKNSELIEKYIDHLDIRFIGTAHLENPYYLENMRSLSSLSFKDKYSFKILMAPGQLQEATKLAKEFYKNSINHHVAAIFDSNLKPLNYGKQEMEYLNTFHFMTEDMLEHEYIKGNDSEVVPYTRIDKRFKPELFAYQGLHCTGGMSTLRLGPNGSLIPCFGAAKKGYRYNLHKKRLSEIPELNAPIICPAEKCNCEIYMKTPKWRYEKDQPAYLNK